MDQLRGIARSPHARAIAASAVTFAAIVLLFATSVAIPLDYLLRPVAVLLIVAVPVGLAASMLGRHAVTAAVVASILLAVPSLWLWAVGIAVIELAIAVVDRRPDKSVIPPGRFSYAAVTVLLVIGAVRLLPLVPDYVQAAEASAWDGPPVYLLLLDGYPRIDTLGELGIDNGPFIDELAARGFDHYPDATSAHGWTHRTLQALLAGSPEGIPDDSGSTEERRAIREELEMPGFEIVDPPVGHVTLRGGDNWSAGGINDFEAHMLGASVLGLVAPGPTGDLIGRSLRNHFERSLEEVAETDASRVFAHFLAPHPPFLYAGGLSPCWPGCDVYDVSTETLGLTLEEWADEMGTHLPAVNERVLGAIDSMIAERPDAVIVLFGDHGARFGNDRDELHKPFLAARTPGHAHLLEDEPHPHAILRLVTEAYR